MKIECQDCNNLNLKTSFEFDKYICGSSIDILIKIPSSEVGKNFTQIGIILKQMEESSMYSENSEVHEERLIKIAHSIWGVESQNFLIHEYEVLLANSGVVGNLKNRFSEFMVQELRDQGYESDIIFEYDPISEDEDEDGDDN